MPFLRNVPGLEAVYRDYAPKGVQFFLLYKSIVHPGTNGFVEAVTLDERIKQVAYAKKRLGTTIPWIVDTLEGDVVKALRSAPNAEFIVDADGKLMSRKFWHDPIALRAWLAERVGPVEPPTDVASLGMQLSFPEAGAPRGLVKPLATPRGLRILHVRPDDADHESADDKTPRFCKLVAEGDRKLLKKGRGTLYLGFYLDPVYEVHWNNPAGGLSWTIESPKTSGQSPSMKHEVDVDPREFLLEDFAAPQDKQPLRVTVRYTICDDAGTFCMPVEQRYVVTLKANPNGGSRAGAWMTDLVGDPMQYDKDGNGRVTADELPAERAQIILLHHDYDHDGAITPPEAKAFLDMIRRRQPGTAR